MKLLRVLPISACLFATLVHGKSEKSPFTNDLDAARKLAKSEHKDILVDFTGSDWCGFCIMLDKEIFHTREYIARAPDHFVSVQLDFPRQTKQPEDVVARNTKWKSEVKSNSFPDVLLLDENGKVYAKTGYRAGGAKLYLEHMEELRQRRIKRDAALALAEKADGLEKAKHLDVALSALRDDDVLLTYYDDTIKQVIALATNDPGLQAKCKAIYQRHKCQREISAICQDKDGAAMLTKLKEYAAKSDIPVESKQYALYMAGAMACERRLRDYPQAIEFYKQAIALAPDSPLVESRLKPALARGEESARKAKAGQSGQRKQ